MPKQTNLSKQGHLWQDKDKERAVRVYKSLSNLEKTSQITGIPRRTLNYWVLTDWWKEKLRALRAEDTLELEEAATSIAKQANGIVQERLANGDFVLNRDGELVRKPVSARDAAIISAVNIDKRKILQEEPIREQQLDTSERLLKLVEQFARFSSAKEIKGVLKEEKPVIETAIFQKVDEINVNAEQPELQTELPAGSS